ncbi:hypothetical protein Rhopal_003236-T1 [Rhodotorula paludigena]|uniref:Transcription factor hoxa13 n=1 Tax=Rhodotorula paludigena TaxID=86838 RepID=A0AAV5GLJ7_9BASI|nr:hypothetical protein Rhopal_003236-T1 [Rhodotorula paludigena]
MPPRTTLGGASPRKHAAHVPAAALDGPRPLDGGDQQIVPRDQKPQPGDQRAYQPGSPIRFYVKRMHDELDQRAPGERSAARRALRSSTGRSRSSGISLRGFLTRVALLYLCIAYFFVCPADPSRERAVCRGIDSVGNRLRQYEPHLRPYVSTAQRKLEPYVAEAQRRTEPYVAKVRPHYRRVDSLVRPHVSTVGSFYRSHVYPAVVSTVHRSQELTAPYTAKLRKQYTKSLEPSVEWYSLALGKWYAARVEPHVSQISTQARQYGTTVYRTVSPLWTRGLPAAQHHLSTHVLPFSRRTYASSRRAYVTHVHPRAVTLGGHAHGVYRSRVLPALQRFWSRFIAPQLDKIRERIFDYKAKKAKLEAIERVEKASEAIAHEHGEDDIEDFIKDLRNDGLEQEVDPSPAIPAEEAPPAYSSSVPPPPPTPEEAAAQRAEKRAALEALQSTYESEIAALGQAEHQLLVARLADLRQHAEADIPKRFDAALEALDDEGDKMVGRLGKYFARVAGDDKTSVEDKVRDSDDLCAKAVARVSKAAEEIEAEIDAYGVELDGREKAAVDKAQKAVSDLVSKATDELGRGWTWLDGTTAKDWQRYHGLRRAELNLHASFADLQSGAIKDASLASLKPRAVLAEYRQQPAKLVKAFETILSKIKVKGQRELKGEWLGVVDEAQKAYDSVSGKMAHLVDDLKESASSVAGYERKPTGVAQSVSSLAKAAQASASSLAAEAVNALPTIEAHHEYVAAAKAAYGDASQQVLRAVGVEPIPTDFRQRATSLANAASASAAHAYAEASQSALRALGAEPSPTDVAQSMTSIAHVASASAASAYSQVMSDYPASISSALHKATQAVDSVAEEALSSASSLAASAASVVSSLAAPAATMLNPAAVSEQVEGAQERANEFFGEVSHDAMRAVGREPSPTDLAQSATSAGRAASSAISSAASAASSLAAPHSDYSAKASQVASRSASNASASARSSLSSASASASSASRSVSRSASSASASASSAARPAASAASRSVVSAASQASAGAQRAKSAAESLAKPHSSYRKSQAAAAGASATDRVKKGAASAASQVRRAVPLPSGGSSAPTGAAKAAAESASSVVDKVKSGASPHPAYKASQAQEKVVKATERVKKAVVHGEL